jgi:hypothetical protein
LPCPQVDDPFVETSVCFSIAAICFLLMLFILTFIANLFMVSGDEKGKAPALLWQVPTFMVQCPIHVMMMCPCHDAGHRELCVHLLVTGP